MQSKAATVELYLQEVPPKRSEALKKIRCLCLSELKGYEEVMMYGSPCYIKNGLAEVGFASQKNSINIYILKTDVMEKYKGLLKGVGIGKGCIRFSNPEKIDYAVIQKMLRGTYESTKSICG